MSTVPVRGLRSAGSDNALELRGVARYFGALAAKVPTEGALPGVAGFRLNWPLNRPDRSDEVVSFVVARCPGQGRSAAASLSYWVWTVSPSISQTPSSHSTTSRAASWSKAA